MSELSTINEACNSNLTQNGDNLRDFFEESAETALLTAPKTSKKVSYCSSWVNDHELAIAAPEDSPSDSNCTEFVSSPLPESVTSFTDLINRKKRKIQEEPSEQPIKTKNPREFFAHLDRAAWEIEAGSSKWEKIDGIYVRKAGDSDENEKFKELMNLFHTDRSIYETMTLENTYSFDWKSFSKVEAQSLIFTKFCRSHPPDSYIEMRKENVYCSDCKSTDLAVAVRVVVPLDLSDVPIPCNLDIKVYVAFLTKHLFGDDSDNFSDDICERMFNFSKSLLIGRETPEYTTWFDDCRKLAKEKLSSKRLRLNHGHVARRKFEEDGNFHKRRCFIFVHDFNLE